MAVPPSFNEGVDPVVTVMSTVITVSVGLLPIRNEKLSDLGSLAPGPCAASLTVHVTVPAEVGALGVQTPSPIPSKVMLPFQLNVNDA